MSQIHVNQITGHLRRAYAGLIDLSDMDGAPDAEKEKAFLTRSLAAFAIAQLSGASNPDAVASVTDGQGDNGIDALHYDGAARTLYVVQSKWFSNGHGSFDRADMLKFTKAFKDLTSLSFGRFNKKVRDKSDIVQSSFFDDQAKYVLVMIYTGQDPWLMNRNEICKTA